MNVDQIVAQLDEAKSYPTDPLVRVITNDRAWLVPIGEACRRFDINTDARRAMFLAQAAHESDGFTRLVESLHYSAARLLAVFRAHFTPAEATQFAYDDVRIGERVYGGRMGNGPEGVGDGYAYRGRGLLQITGRAMYRECGRALGIDLEALPKLLEVQTWAALSAAWVWTDEKACNALADAGDFERCTRAINGGVNGYEQRLAWLDRLRAA